MSTQDILSGRLCGCVILEAEIDHYISLCETDPAKVVDAIRVNPDRPLATAKYHAAQEAIFELVAPDDDMPGDNETWSGLVDAGVVDVLIDNVLYREVPECPPACATRIGLDYDTWELRLLDRTAPYWKCFKVLTYTPDFFSRPHLSARDTRVMSALRSRWSSIMRRVWDQPYRTLRPGEEHTLERSGFTAILEVLISIESDPSFIESVFEDDTIPVIARFWRHSGGCPTEDIDAFATTTTLSHLSEIAWDRRLEPSAVSSKVTVETFLKQACIGVSSHIQDASETEKMNALLDAFGTRFIILNGIEVERALAMAGLLLNTSREMRVAVSRNGQFWVGLFSIPCRILKGKAIGHQGERTDKNKMISPFTIFAAMLAKTPVDMHEDLIRSCVRGKMLDILDEVAHGLLDLDRLAMVGPEGSASETLAHVFAPMLVLANSCDDDMKKLLRKQFPRWRTSFALLKFYVETSPAGPVPDFSTEDLDLRTLSWMLFVKLHMLCKPKTLCARRGCKKDGASACSGCKTSFYCSEDCQKRDWKDHRALCGPRGLMGLVAGVEGITPTDLISRYTDAVERTAPSWLGTISTRA